MYTHGLPLALLSLCVTISAAAQRRQQPEGDWRHYLSFCIIFKDESKYLREWIEFHRRVGVDKFYLYSNDSKDKYKAVLKPYTTSGLVTLIEWPTHVPAKGKQSQTQCMDYGPQSRWMGFFDVDEFVYPTNGDDDTLWSVLQRFEPYGGLLVRNALYGSSGFVNSPQNYVYRAPLTNPTYADAEDDVMFHVKSIVDARHGVGCKHGAHVMALDDPERYLVNEKFEKHNATGKHGPKGKAAVDLIRYNHYKGKSIADWQEKVCLACAGFAHAVRCLQQKDKGTVQGAAAAQKFAKIGNHWENVDRNDVFDDSIYRFLPALREAFGLVEGEYPLG